MSPGPHGPGSIAVRSSTVARAMDQCVPRPSRAGLHCGYVMRVVSIRTDWVPRPSRAGLHCGRIRQDGQDRIGGLVPRPSRAGLHCGCFLGRARRPRRGGSASSNGENGNGLIRRYVGKSTNLATSTPEDLRAIEHRINTIPRRSLGWDTAHDRYHAAVAMTG